MGWFGFAILSALFWGLEGFLHKVSSKRGYDSSKISLLLAGTASILSLLLFLITQEKLFNLNFLLLIAFLNSVTFFFSFITRLESLRTLDVSVFFPISKVGTLLVLVLLSVLTLNEQPETSHWIGILLSCVSIYLLTAVGTKNQKRNSSLNIGYLFLVLSIISTAFANYTADIAATRTGTYSFIFLSYALGIPISFIAGKLFKRIGKGGRHSDKGLGVYSLGIAIGILNFVGFVFFLLALGQGQLSLVGAINNFQILLTILLSVWIYKEKPTIKQYAGIFLAMVALVIFW